MRPRTRALSWDPGTANPKQREFFRSRALYTAYGGAKGGGKTWAVRTKALLGAYYYPGIRILIMRRTYPELLSNHIEPMRQALRPAFAKYSAERRAIYFANGSVIRFGHWAGEKSESEYNGQEFDWIFIDEATQFTYRAFQFLGSLLRGVNDIPKRMYLTCNPGGVGHRWVKRLFIDRKFVTGRENPEENENPDDYVFISATVEDNAALLRASPGYLRLLSALPEDLRDGRELLLGVRRCCPHGGELFAAEGLAEIPLIRLRARHVRLRLVRRGSGGAELYVPRVLRERAGGRRGGEADAAAHAARGGGRGHLRAAGHVEPAEGHGPHHGRTIAEIFFEQGAPIVRAPNSRAQGHMLVKEALRIRQDGRPGLIFMRCCRETIDDMRDIQTNPKDPNDCAREPHEVTHRVDAVRYFCASRAALCPPEDEIEETEDGKISYFEFMTGRRPGKGETWL